MRRFWAIALVILLPILCGFNVYSTAKSEEGNREYRDGKIVKARKAYELALKADPSSEEIAFNLGNAYYKEGNFEKSIGAHKIAAKKQGLRRFRRKRFTISETVYSNGTIWQRLRNFTSRRFV